RVYTVNPATGEYSDEWVGYTLHQPTIYRVNCDSQTSGDQPSPSAPNMAGRVAMAAPMTGDDERHETAATTTEASEATTEAPESSTPESSVTTTPESSGTTSTEPTPTPGSSTTEPTTPSPTEDPKPVLVETVPNGAVTAGWTQGYTRVVVVDGDGAELAGGR